MNGLGIRHSKRVETQLKDLEEKSEKKKIEVCSFVLMLVSVVPHLIDSMADPCSLSRSKPRFSNNPLPHPHSKVLTYDRLTTPLNPQCTVPAFYRLCTVYAWKLLHLQDGARWIDFDRQLPAV